MCDRPGSHFRTSPLPYADEKGYHSANIIGAGTGPAGPAMAGPFSAEVET